MVFQKDNELCCANEQNSTVNSVCEDDRMSDGPPLLLEPRIPDMDETWSVYLPCILHIHLHHNETLQPVRHKPDTLPLRMTGGFYSEKKTQDMQEW